jgi:nucleoside-diphosphate-sugar epimerase
MVLVTGGTGMLGAHLLFQLVNSEASVRAIYRSEDSLEKVKKAFSYFTDAVTPVFSKIEWVRADVRDITSLETAFQGVRQVYHLAALVSFDPSSYSKMRAVNIHGTANVVNLCLDRQVEKLCFVSSIATLSKNHEKTVIDESNEFYLDNQNYGYAITKYGAEMEVWRGAQEGLRILIFNPGVILGAGYWTENSGILFSMAHREFPFYTDGVTGFVGAEDVATLLVKGMNSPLENERFILVSENKSYREIATKTALFFGKHPPRIKINKTIGAIAWRLSWLRSKLTGAPNNFTKHSARAAHKKSYYRSEKVKAAFGFEFEPVDALVQKVAKHYLKAISEGAP